jgi:hypothetical protein
MLLVSVLLLHSPNHHAHDSHLCESAVVELLVELVLLDIWVRVPYPASTTNVSWGILWLLLPQEQL